MALPTTVNVYTGSFLRRSKWPNVVAKYTFDQNQLYTMSANNKRKGFNNVYYNLSQFSYPLNQTTLGYTIQVVSCQKFGLAGADSEPYSYKYGLQNIY